MRLAEAFVDIRPEFSNFRGGLLKGILSEMPLGIKVLGGLGLAAGAALIGGATAAARFESRLSAVRAVSQATEGQMEKVRTKALQLGADTVFSAGEAAGAIEELVKAGLSVEQVLGGAADAAVSLAAAGGVSLEKAATIAANALNSFGLTGSQVANVADIVAGAANASAIGVEDFALSLAQSGAVANLAGLSFKDTATAIALLGNAGIKGSDAGTSLKVMLQNLIPVTDREKNLFRELGIVTEEGGNKFFDAQGHVKGLADISQVLQTALRGQTDQQKLYNLSILFGSDALRAAGILTKAGAAGVRELSAEMADTTAAEVAATRMDNLGGSLEQFRGSLETVLITMGTPLQSGLRDLVDFGTEGLNALASLGKGGGLVSETFGVVIDIGEDLAQLLGDVVSAAAPAVAVLAKLGGGAVVLGLRAIADVLAPLADLLAHNSVVAEVLAGILVTKLVFAVAGLASGLPFVVSLLAVSAAQIVANTVAAVGLYGPLAAARVAAAALGTSLRTIGVGAGFAAVAVGFIEVTKAADDAKAAAQSAFGAITGPALQSNSIKEMAAALAEVKARTADAEGGLSRTGDRFSQFVKGTLQNLTPLTKNTVLNLQRMKDEGKQSAVDIEAAMARATKAIGAISAATGLSADGVDVLATSLRINLAGSDFVGVTKAVIAGAKEMASALLVTGGDVQKAVGLTEAGTKAAEELAKGMADSFGSAASIIGQFNSKLDVGSEVTGFLKDQAEAATASAGASKDLASATKAVRDAQAAEAEAGRQLNAARAANKSDRVASETYQLSQAHDRLSEALSRQAEAQGKVRDTQPKGGGILGFLRSQLAEANAFRANLDELLERSVDPQLVRELAEAGPKASADTVAGVLREVRAGNVGAINETVRSLRDAQGAVKGQALAFFQEQQAEATKFAANLKALIAAGVDPQLLRDIATAGPEAGAGAAAALVAGVRAGSLPQINQTQADLRTILADINREVEAATGPLAQATRKLGEDLVKSIPEGMTATATAIRGDVANLLTSVVLGGVDGARLRALSTADDLGRAIGADIQAGIALGMGTPDPSIAAGVKAVVGNTVKATKEAAGIQSPSKLFADQIGRPIAAGIAAGIAGGAGLVSSELAKVTTARAPKVELAAGSVTAASDAGTTRSNAPSPSAPIDYERLGRTIAGLISPSHSKHTVNHIAIDAKGSDLDKILREAERRQTLAALGGE